MEYNKEKINSLTITFLETGDGFEDLLAELEKMCWKVLYRYPKYKEYWEDLRQEMLIKIWQCLGKADNLKRLLSDNVPADFFFSRLRGYALDVIPTVDPSFDPRHPNISKYSSKHPDNKDLSDSEIRDKFLNRTSSGYDNLDDKIIGFEDMSKADKMKVFSETGEDNEED